MNTLYHLVTSSEPKPAAGFNTLQTVIDSERLKAPGAKNLSVVIPSPDTPEWVTRHIAKKQRKLGRDALYYTFDKRMISANVDQTLEAFTNAANRVKEDVEWSGADRIRLISAGLGDAVLMLALGSDESLSADEIVLSAPSGDLAGTVWTSKRKEDLRSDIEAQHLDFADLQNKWRDISPIQQAANVAGRAITIHVSMADNVNAPGPAYELAEALAETNDVSLYVNRSLGHYGTILANA